MQHVGLWWVWAGRGNIARLPGVALEAVYWVTCGYAIELMKGVHMKPQALQTSLTSVKDDTRYYSIE